MSLTMMLTPVKNKRMEKYGKSAMEKSDGDSTAMTKIEKKLFSLMRKSNYDEYASLKELEWMKTREPGVLELFIISQSFKKFKFKAVSDLYEAFRNIDYSENEFSDFTKLSIHNQEFIVSKVALSRIAYSMVDDYTDAALVMKDLNLNYLYRDAHDDFKKFYKLNKKSLKLNSYKESLQTNKTFSSNICAILLNAKEGKGQREVIKISSWGYSLYLALYFIYGDSVLELIELQTSSNFSINIKDFINLLGNWEQVKELPLEWALNL